eukprot:1561842-Pleurochrysis_carterae.AAC.1
MWELRMEWARTLFAECTSTHWGTRLGLYLSLTEHMPTRQIRRINQAPPPTCKRSNAASREFDPESNVYNKVPLVYNPHRASDVIYVPNILPPLNKFLPEIRELTRELGLSMSAEGGLAFQTLETLASE